MEERCMAMVFLPSVFPTLQSVICWIGHKNKSVSFSGNNSIIREGNDPHSFRTLRNCYCGNPLVRVNTLP